MFGSNDEGLSIPLRFKCLSIAYLSCMSWGYVVTMLVLIVFAWLSVKANKLTPAAAIAGWLIAVLLLMTTGFIGVLLMAAFFLLGTFATSHRLLQKQQLHLAETNKGRRTAGQVFANAGVAGVCSILVFFSPGHTHLLKLMIAGSFASATADTLSSELGNVYGRRYYNILSFKRDVRGRDGVISLEGTLLGVAGSAVIALIYAMGERNYSAILLLLAAGTVGNMADSILGATLERKGRLTNNQVNFLNTLIGALVMLLAYRL